VSAIVPTRAEDVGALRSMDDVKHLDVRLDRLRHWCAVGDPPET
jgi:hypothetical protein